MQRDSDEDQRAFGTTGDEPLAESAQESDEAETRGREVEDLTRAGETRGRDVLTDAEQPNIESHGRDVVDRSHIAETRGVDVIDLGPATPTSDEPRQP
jgi:hypothetical protein